MAALISLSGLTRGIYAEYVRFLNWAAKKNALVNRMSAFPDCHKNPVFLWKSQKRPAEFTEIAV